MRSKEWDGDWGERGERVVVADGDLRKPIGKGQLHREKINTRKGKENLRGKGGGRLELSRVSISLMVLVRNARPGDYREHPTKFEQKERETGSKEKGSKRQTGTFLTGRQRTKRRGYRASCLPLT